MRKQASHGARSRAPRPVARGCASGVLTLPARPLRLPLRFYGPDGSSTMRASVFETPHWHCDHMEIALGTLLDASTNMAKRRVQQPHIIARPQSLQRMAVADATRRRNDLAAELSDGVARAAAASMKAAVAPSMSRAVRAHGRKAKKAKGESKAGGAMDDNVASAIAHAVTATSRRLQVVALMNEVVDYWATAADQVRQNAQERTVRLQPLQVAEGVRYAFVVRRWQDAAKRVAEQLDRPRRGSHSWDRGGLLVHPRDLRQHLRGDTRADVPLRRTALVVEHRVALESGTTGLTADTTDDSTDESVTAGAGAPIGVPGNGADDAGGADTLMSPTRQRAGEVLERARQRHVAQVLGAEPAISGPGGSTGIGDVADVHTTMEPALEPTQQRSVVPSIGLPPPRLEQLAGQLGGASQPSVSKSNEPAPSPAPQKPARRRRRGSRGPSPSSVHSGVTGRGRAGAGDGRTPRGNRAKRGQRVPKSGGRPSEARRSPTASRAGKASPTGDATLLQLDTRAPTADSRVPTCGRDQQDAPTPASIATPSSDVAAAGEGAGPAVDVSDKRAMMEAQLTHHMIHLVHDETPTPRTAATGQAKSSRQPLWLESLGSTVTSRRHSLGGGVEGADTLITELLREQRHAREASHIDQRIRAREFRPTAAVMVDHDQLPLVEALEVRARRVAEASTNASPRYGFPWSPPSRPCLSCLGCVSAGRRAQS